MIRSRPAMLLAAVAALTLILAACGGGGSGDGDGNGDEAVGGELAEPSSAEPSAAEPSASDLTGAGDAPNATVSPALPAELAGEVGPVEVVGDALPGLQRFPIADDPALGSAVPVLVGQNFAGETIRIDPAADGPTMVVFLAHWCPHCNAEVPRLNELRDAGRFPADLNIVAVSTAVNQGQPNFPPSNWITEVDWTYPVMADGIDVVHEQLIAATAYGVDGFPFVTLVDADGNVAARWSGEREPDEVIELIGTHLGLG